MLSFCKRPYYRKTRQKWEAYHRFEELLSHCVRNRKKYQSEKNKNSFNVKGKFEFLCSMSYA